SPPSSVCTCSLPDRMYPTWWAWHESVFAIGFTFSDHRQPGSKEYRPMVVSPIFTTWTRPLSKVLVSSGLSKLLFVTLMPSPFSLVRRRDPISSPSSRTFGRPRVRLPSLDEPGPENTLAEMWTGTSFQVMSTPNVNGDTFDNVLHRAASD